MRLFAAIVPPPHALQHLDAAVQPLRDGVVRWSSPEAWHITLAFYGEIPDERVADLSDRLERAAGRHTRLELSLAGAGRFGGRILWVGCAGDPAALQRMADSCGAAGRRAGADVDTDRRLRAHVTLARAPRQPVDLGPYVAALAEYAGPTWTATEIALVRSQLGAGEGGRPRYQELAAFNLAS
jgi:RNA 2',3'-cyclic 3'-phosphodiesterase